jgi:MoxR-like ATPase
MNGQDYVVPQTVKDIAADVLRHRIIISYEAEAQGIDCDQVVQMILDGVDVP